MPIKQVHDLCVIEEPKFYYRDGAFYDYAKNIYNIFDYVITTALKVVGIDMNPPSEIDEKKDSTVEI